MKKLLLLILPFLLVACGNESHSVSVGSTVYCNATIGTFTVAAYDELANCAASDDLEGFENVLFRGDGVRIPKNACVFVIDKSIRYSKVRLDSGLEVYVNSELLSDNPF